MVKMANVIIQLIPESEEVDNKKIEKDIEKTLMCAWLLNVKTIKIKQ